MKYRLFIDLGEPLRLSYAVKSLRDCERLINHYFDFVEVEIRDYNIDDMLAFYSNISRKSAPLQYEIYLNRYNNYKIKLRKNL